MDGFLKDIEVTSSNTETLKASCEDKTTDLRAFYGPASAAKGADGKTCHYRDCNECS